MTFNIGDYLIEPLNNSNFKVHFTATNNTKGTMELDLYSIIGIYVFGHLAEIRRILFLIEESSLQTFLNDPHALQLLHAIPNSAVIPGRTFASEQEIKDWRNQLIIEAYNQIHHTYLSYHLIRNYL